MPPQWLGILLHLYPKIVLGHIVCVDIGFVQHQIMLPGLQTMHYTEWFILISWASLLTTIELFVLICNDHPSCINALQMAKSLASVCTSMGLSNFVNLSMVSKDNLFFSSS